MPPAKTDLTLLGIRGGLRVLCDRAFGLLVVVCLVDLEALHLVAGKRKAATAPLVCSSSAPSPGLFDSKFDITTGGGGFFMQPIALHLQV